MKRSIACNNNDNNIHLLHIFIPGTLKFYLQKGFSSQTLYRGFALDLPLEKSKNRHISATVWPIAIKFGMVMHFTLYWQLQCRVTVFFVSWAQIDLLTYLLWLSWPLPPLKFPPFENPRWRRLKKSKNRPYPSNSSSPRQPESTTLQNF